MDWARKVKAVSFAMSAASAMAFVASVAQAEPDYQSVGGLRDNCYLATEKWEEIDVQEQIQATACLSFVAGVAEMMITNCINDYPVPDKFKSSSSHTMRAFIQGFLNWADENPNRWSDKKFLGLVDAISMNFPCGE